MGLSHNDINDAILKFVTEKGLVDQEGIETAFGYEMYSEIIRITQLIANNFDVIEAYLNNPPVLIGSLNKLHAKYPYLTATSTKRIIQIAVDFWTPE